MWFKLATANFTDKNLGKMADIAGSWGVSYSLQGNITKNSCPTTVKMNDGKTQAEADFTATFILGNGATLTSITATLKSSGATLVTETSNPSITIPAASITGDIIITAIASGTSSGGGSEGDDDTTDPTPDGTISVTWEQGAIDSGNGPNSSASMSNRARTKNYIQVNSSITISCSGNAEFCPIYYNADKTYISSPNAYQTDTLTIDGSTYPLVRIMIRDKSNTNATMSAAFGENYMTITGDGIEIPYDGSTGGDTSGIHDGATWVVGAIDSSTGKAVGMSTRIRTGYIELGTKTVSVTGNAEFCPFLYDSSKSLKSTPAVYQTTSQTFTSSDGAYLVLMARDKTNTSATLTTDFGQYITIA